MTKAQPEQWYLGLTPAEWGMAVAALEASADENKTLGKIKEARADRALARKIAAVLDG